MEGSDNVIILGAGASADAGIPLLRHFINTMWECSVRKQIYGAAIPDNDCCILQEAIDIKNELDTYHGRALFDDRNIEDILSILSFNETRGTKADKTRLHCFIRAISKTIELTCNVKYENNGSIQDIGSKQYRRFWINLLNWYKTKRTFPTIINFNYDLVLERSLFQVLTNTIFRARDLPFSGININYGYRNSFENKFQIKEKRYGKEAKQEGTTIQKRNVENCLDIEILKLHGSLNFYRERNRPQSSLFEALDDPCILPPVVNKFSYGKAIDKIWSVALNRLRNAKNVIIVGYSLPKTDIYMQYFLKTALGPNLSLNNIFVFDPVLYKDNEDTRAIIERYGSCFSPQFQRRIVFQPSIPWGSPSGEYPTKDTFIKNTGGTFEHFVKTINHESGILF